MKHNGFSIPYIKFLSTKSAEDSKISESVILPDMRYVTVTAGLVYGEIKNFENVIKKADDYLYIGKNKGKNCIVWYRNENI